MTAPPPTADTFARPVGFVVSEREARATRPRERHHGGANNVRGDRRAWQRAWISSWRDRIASIATRA